jgi:ribose-phosphate pyrophosphokinase
MSHAQVPLLFALGASREFGTRIAQALDTTLARHEEREFEDGEHKARPLDAVEGRDVCVVHALYGDGTQGANDKLCRLLFFLGALRDAGAERVTALVPYLCYARKDRRTQPHDPLPTRYVAALFEAVGVARMVALDVHNPAAFENAFRCTTVHLEARPLFVAHLADALRGQALGVLSPDEGGAKRADAFRQALAEACGDDDIAFGFMEKRRAGGAVAGEHLYADVAGRSVVVVDDLVSTGGTLLRAARAARSAGARAVIAVATHGLFVGDANSALADPAIDRIVIANSVPPFRLAHGQVERKLAVVDVAPLFAAALRGSATPSPANLPPEGGG